MKKWLIGVVLLLSLIVLALAVWMAGTRPYYLSRFHVLVLAVRPGTNGSAQVDVLITNGTSVPLNVIDDASGKTAFFLETETGTSSAVTPRMNLGTINLAPGTSLTNCVVLTNPPARFRLVCTLRNLEAERKVWGAHRFLPKTLAARLVELRRREWDLPFQYSKWVDFQAATNSGSAGH
jgi:hypothetical protein